MLVQDCEYGFMLHFRCPGSWCSPRFGIRFMDRRATLDQQFDQLRSSPAAGPAQRCGLEQVIAQVQPGAVIEQHGSKARAIFVCEATVMGRSKMQRSLAEA